METAFQGIVNLRRVLGVCGICCEYVGNGAWQDGRIRDIIFGIVRNKHYHYDISRGAVLQGKNHLEKRAWDCVMRWLSCNY